MSTFELAPRPRLDDVKRLLDAAGLPSSDLDDGMLEHFHAGMSDGKLIGIVGLEPYGRNGLLRSLVVDTGARGDGIGRRLVGEAERHAASLGIETLYLLTDTAETWFRRLGYSDCARDAAPEGVRSSKELSSLCPADAAFLCKRLRSHPR